VRDGVLLLSFSVGFAYFFCIGVQNRILLPTEVALVGGELTGDLVCGLELVDVFLKTIFAFLFLGTLLPTEVVLDVFADV
jgi:hypothetical protein